MKGNTLGEVTAAVTITRSCFYCRPHVAIYRTVMKISHAPGLLHLQYFQLAVMQK